MSSFFCLAGHVDVIAVSIQTRSQRGPILNALRTVKEKWHLRTSYTPSKDNSQEGVQWLAVDLDDSGSSHFKPLLELLQAFNVKFQVRSPMQPPNSRRHRILPVSCTQAVIRPCLDSSIS